jgi:hypothetical protein
MNYLFTFQDRIDVYMLIEFEMFCWELNEIICITTSANEESNDFPPNFILVYVDTENEQELDTITNKYHRLIAESEDCLQGQFTKMQSICQ